MSLVAPILLSHFFRIVLTTVFITFARYQQFHVHSQFTPRRFWGFPCIAVLFGLPCFWASASDAISRTSCLAVVSHFDYSGGSVVLFTCLFSLFLSLSTNRAVLFTAWTSASCAFCRLFLLPEFVQGFIFLGLVLFFGSLPATRFGFFGIIHAYYLPHASVLPHDEIFMLLMKSPFQRVARNAVLLSTSSWRTLLLVLEKAKHMLCNFCFFLFLNDVLPSIPLRNVVRGMLQI